MDETRRQLRGWYYGQGTPTPSDLETSGGRQRMREVISDLLATAEASGASAELISAMRDDLAALDE